eukprot:gene51466-70070_t
MGVAAMRRVFLVAILALAACGHPPPTTVSEPPPEVRIARVGGGAGQALVTGVGTIALRREASLGFTSAGRIASLNVNE